MVVVTCAASGDDWSCGREVKQAAYCSVHRRQMVRNGRFLPIAKKTFGLDRWLDGKRRCESCDDYLDALFFGNSQDDPDGLKKSCKPCEVSKGLRYRFNITLERYNEMLEDQDGVCAICQTNPGDRRLAVDHDHSCCPGKKSCGACVRALLCARCNTSIGQFEDNPELLRRAATYLEERSG